MSKNTNDVVSIRLKLFQNICDTYKLQTHHCQHCTEIWELWNKEITQLNTSPLLQKNTTAAAFSSCLSLNFD